MGDRIVLAHGGGGRLSRELVEQEITPRFANPGPSFLPDAATLARCSGEIVFSTDSFVVQPIFFPGGTIGHLAVHGTVNDIAAAGGKPRWLSIGLILEEGLLLDDLRRVLDALKEAAEQSGVSIVTGDTKVVERGRCDGMYINSAGIGERLEGFELRPERMCREDVVLVSGTIGDHGMAVLAARNALQLSNGPLSDTAPVHRLVTELGKERCGVRVMRDPTRGGVAAVLNELIDGAGVGFELDEQALPFSPASRAVAEMMGIDLLQVACEGRLLAVCAPEAARDVLACWQALPEGRTACVIGHVTGQAGRVVLKTAAGGRRLIDTPEGELLPRIC